MLHIEKMKQERNELSNRLQKLNEFILGDSFKEVDEMEQLRMIKQSGFMESYLEILDARIWCNT